MKNRIKAIACTLLATALLSANLLQPAVVVAQSPLPAPQSTAAATIANKEEVVYANLDANGNATTAYVVNEFTVTQAGQLYDHGAYASAANLSTTSPLAQNGDVWSVDVEPGNFYYQGNMENARLPWAFTINYFLDGTPIEASALAGQSGQLQMRISSRQNTGVNSTFYNNYMLQISITLGTSQCSNIVSQGATIATAGKNKVVSHTVMPGKNADITLTATVQNFSMSGIEISAIPYSMEMELPDTGEMVEEMTTLADAIGTLNDGVRELNNGVNDLNSGVGDLENGSATFASGLNQLSNNSGQLVNGSSQINAALGQLAASLNGQDTGSAPDLSSLALLPANLRQMAQGLGMVASGLAQLKDGYALMFGALDAAILGIPATAIADADIAALSAAVAAMPDTDPGKPAAQNALAQLLATYGAAQTVLGTYLTANPATGVSIQAGMGAVTSSLDTMAASIDVIVTSLNTMADGIEQALSDIDLMAQLEQLAQGLSALATKYEDFHNGLVEYTGGVSQVASGYSSLHNGIAELHDGTDELADGTQDLYEGTSELADAVAELPETIELEIDSLMEEYTPNEFTPVSFVSAQNTNISYVQFVMMTEAIAISEEEPAGTDEGGGESMWDRFLNLFR